jgi:cell wall-associated NlpC family hydrolase/uncharacterized protein YgiM (DUF1202 family)
MRKPIIALGLAVTAGLGAIPVAEVQAATHTGSTLSTTNPGYTPPQQTYSSTTQDNSSQGTTGQASNVSGAAIVQTALKYLGYPYTATGNSPATGFSCIGFVSYVYHVNGIPLPGDLQDAFAYASQVSFADLEPGDILYFQNTVWPGISHAAIYLGGGRFVHSEWYGYGVRISSFYNDPKDGNYWIGKYLGANRPWGGAAVAPVVSSAPAPSSSAATTTQVSVPSATTQNRIVSGPTAVVSVAANVRSGPSTKYAKQTVAAAGTEVAILAKQGGWYKVQMPDGTVGWIIAAGIGRAASSSAGPATAVNGTNGATTASTSAATTAKQIASPSVAHAPARAKAAVRASGLRVHSSPSLNAAVITTVAKGQKLVILARVNGWVKVRVPDGQVGWVSGAYVSAPKSVAPPAASTAARTVSATIAGGTTAKVATHVRVSPSLTAAISTTLAPGMQYKVLGWSNGWAHVELSNGAIGWISGTVIGTGSTTSSVASGSSTKAKVATASSTSYPHVLTAGVRIHSRPGINAPVIGLAAAGTHLAVLGFKLGWDYVKFATGKSGYIIGTYVR